MKHVTILIFCFFLVSISVLTFADDPVQVKQPEQKVEAESAEQGNLIKEARELPSTLITDEEERSKDMKEVEELRKGYVYDDVDFDD